MATSASEGKDFPSQNLKTKGQLMVFNTEQDVTNYCKANGNLHWIIFEGHVYDVTDYLHQHPGG